MMRTRGTLCSLSSHSDKEQQRAATSNASFASSLGPYPSSSPSLSLSLLRLLPSPLHSAGAVLGLILMAFVGVGLL